VPGGSTGLKHRLLSRKEKKMIETFNPRFEKFGTVSLRICGVKIFIYAGICRRVMLFLVDVGRDIASSIDALWMVKMGLLAALIGSLSCLSNNYRQWNIHH